MEWLRNDHSLFLAEHELRNTRHSIQMRNREFFFISLFQKIVYTKCINTLKILQEKFLDTRQILNTIKQVQATDVEGFVYDH